ncbi:MAG: sigma factor, partial [Pirellula sp.]
MTDPASTTSQPDPNDCSEEELIEAAKGSADALTALYRLHYAAIYGYVLRRVGKADDTHDIVSDVFVNMVRYLPRFRWTGAPFRSWLLRLANSA